MLQVKYVSKDSVFEVKNYFLDVSDPTKPRVWSAFSNRFLKYSTKKSGYERVRLSHNGEILECKMHRLVAATYGLFNQDSLHLVVNHKDNNRLNNCIDNLEVVTNKENNRHAAILLKTADPKIYTFYSQEKSFRGTRIEQSDFWGISTLAARDVIRAGRHKEIRLEGFVKRKYKKNAIYKFRHELHGTILATRNQMMSEFGCKKMELDMLVYSQIDSHKGWSCLGVED